MRRDAEKKTTTRARGTRNVQTDVFIENSLLEPKTDLSGGRREKAVKEGGGGIARQLNFGGFNEAELLPRRKA